MVADIKARLTVEDVIGSYLSLKKTGSSYKALSPFKVEKTPSLVVTPGKEIWKDFSSGKGGNMFTFIMEHEGLSYWEAVKLLAEKAGLDIRDYQDKSNSRQPSAKQEDLRQKTLAVLEEATLFYCRMGQKSTKVRAYLKKRGFQKDIIESFRLGYAPDSWQALHDYLHAQDRGSLKYANLAGLLKKRQVPKWRQDKEKLRDSAQWGDFFADRLMIPLSDSFGAVIGFTSRILDDKPGYAKYINSKQTLLYNKSRHVFGYFQAKDAIRQADFALVVEGNLDVVACHQAGWRQTVAAAGTALTLDHLRIIGRLSKNVRLAFDGDAAGTTAMERSLYAASLADLNLSVINLPVGQDPDDVIRLKPKLWQRLVDSHQPAPDWLYDKYKASLDLKTATGKKKFTDIMLPIINCLKDEVEKDHYLEKLSQEGISLTSLERKLRKVAQSELRPRAVEEAAQNQAADHELQALDIDQSALKWRLHILLGLLLVEPALRGLQKPQEKQIVATVLADYPQEQAVYQVIEDDPSKIDTLKRLPASLKTHKSCVQVLLKVVQSSEPGTDKKYSDFPLEDKRVTCIEIYGLLDMFLRKKEQQNKH